VDSVEDCGAVGSEFGDEGGDHAVLLGHEGGQEMDAVDLLM